MRRVQGSFALLCVWLAVVASTAPGPASARTLLLGINDNAPTVLNWAWVSAHHPERAGARILRTGVRWDVVQPRPGTWRWAQYDRLFALEARRGLALLPVLGLPPHWTGLAWNQLPRDPRGFAAFAAAVAARYGPGGRFWHAHPRLNGMLAARWLDVWNEPYLNAYSAGGVNPAAYARMVRAVALAVRRVVPNEKLLLEANTYWQVPGGWAQDWLNQLYWAVPDLNRYFDVASVHTYCSNPATGFAAGQGSCRRVDALHFELALHGAADKPLWMTEFGWPTCNEGGTYPGCVSGRQDAANLRELLFYFVSQPYITALFPYSYQNLWFPSTGIVDTFGLLDWVGRPKPAYRAWMAFVRTQQSGPLTGRTVRAATQLGG